MAENERPMRIVPHDSTIVGVYDPAELQFWCERFSVAPEDIQEAVKTVGPRFDDVDYFLNERFARRRPVARKLLSEEPSPPPKTPDPMQSDGKPPWSG